MNAVYRPTATGKPATVAYAMALGSTTAAAVSPATTSKRSEAVDGSTAFVSVEVSVIVLIPGARAVRLCAEGRPARGLPLSIPGTTGALRGRHG